MLLDLFLLPPSASNNHHMLSPPPCPLYAASASSHLSPSITREGRVTFAMYLRSSCSHNVPVTTPAGRRSPLFLPPAQWGSFPSQPFPHAAVSLSARKPWVRGALVSERASAADLAVENLADRLRLGSLTEDGLSYKEKFIVRCYEVGINKTATVETIANLLQEVGGNHAQSVGYSTDGFATTPTMRKLNLIWVTSRMHIEIYKYPAWSDVIEIETWCQAEGRIGIRRDWIMKDCVTDQVIGRATSKWVMMNQNTRKLEKVGDDVREEVLMFCPRELRLSFPEENNRSLKKIPKLEDPAEHSRLRLVPRRADLDMNQHVNNVTYIGWVLESLPQEIIDSYELETITLDYRRECQHDDVVDSLSSPETNGNSKDLSQLNGTNGSVSENHEHRKFLHFLRVSGGGLEINRGRTEWRMKSTR